MHRRDFCKRLAAAPAALLASPALIRSSFADEVSKVTIMSQRGLPYLPLMVMQANKMVEKQAQRLGVASLTVEYNSFAGPNVLVDALLSGQMNFGVTGVPSVATLWDKTLGTANEVRALCAVQSMPFMLVSNRPEVKTIKDFTGRDKIAVPSVKTSNQALCLQMAAAAEWGQSQFDKLDALTITRSHPDAATAIMSKSTEITGHYSVAPFYYFELATSGVHKVLNSYDTLGGPTTNGTLLMMKKFRDANPKITAAVFAALNEAEDFINKSGHDAPQIYIAATNEKRSTVDEMAKMISDPDNVWTTLPQKSMRYVEFMHKVGTLKHMPDSWKDLYMPEVHALPGS